MDSEPTVVTLDSEGKMIINSLGSETQTTHRDVFIYFVNKYNKLLSLADDMHVTLVNEIGNTVAARNYKEYLESSL